MSLRSFYLSPRPSEFNRIFNEKKCRLFAPLHFNSLITNKSDNAVRIKRSTIAAANTEYFTVIIFDAQGNELYRMKGRDDIPNVPNSDSFWWNLMVVPLKDYKRPIKVRVVDTLTNEVYEFKGE